MKAKVLFNMFKSILIGILLLYSYDSYASSSSDQSTNSRRNSNSSQQSNSSDDSSIYRDFERTLTKHDALSLLKHPRIFRGFIADFAYPEGFHSKYDVIDALKDGNTFVKKHNDYIYDVIYEGHFTPQSEKMFLPPEVFSRKKETILLRIIIKIESDQQKEILEQLEKKETPYPQRKLLKSDVFALLNNPQALPGYMAKIFFVGHFFTKSYMIEKLNDVNTFLRKIDHDLYDIIYEGIADEFTHQANPIVQNELNRQNGKKVETVLFRVKLEKKIIIQSPPTATKDPLITRSHINLRKGSHSEISQIDERIDFYRSLADRLQKNDMRSTYIDPMHQPF